MKRRLVSLLLSVCVVATMFVGCGNAGTSQGGTNPADTEQRTEVENTEVSTQSTETEEKVVKGKFKEPYAMFSGVYAYKVVEQYIHGGSFPNQKSYSEFNTFMNSDAASEAREAFDFMRKRYDKATGYSNGTVVVDKLAYTISYDGETFEPIQLDEEYVCEDGMQIACLYQYTLVPTEKSGLDPIMVSVVMILERDSSYAGGCRPIGVYNTDSMSKYFPNYNTNN